MPVQKPLTILSHTIALLGTIVLVFFWRSVPSVSQYSLQIFCLVIGSFFIAKKLQKAKVWHILPKNSSLEMCVFTFATLLLIGTTGNTESVFYPFAFIHLFFLVLTAHPITATFTTFGIAVFHYALSPVHSTEFFIDTIILFVALGIFLVSKTHYDELTIMHNQAKLDSKQLNKETQIINTYRKIISRNVIPLLQRLRFSAPLPPEIEIATKRTESELKELL